jgi:hypothetical protein
MGALCHVDAKTALPVGSWWSVDLLSYWPFRCPLFQEELVPKELKYSVGVVIAVRIPMVGRR